jgi:hydroxymethylglutaryl-CoA lyase
VPPTAAPARVSIVEVSPRDGLQNEKALLPASVKIELVDRLAAAGIRTIEVTSFVSPKAIPQLADADEVMAGIRRRPGVRYSVLVPNLKGWERAVASRPDGIVVFGAASETFSQKNINCSIAESIERFRPVVSAARAAGVAVRGTISCALGCPYEGEIAPSAVARVAREMLAIGVDELSIADTIGIGFPRGTGAVLDAVLPLVDVSRVNLHLHDTYARALANIGVGLDRGVRSFDSSAGGLGGCPFAPGATGNVSTEAVLELLEERGLATGIDSVLLRETGAWIRSQLTRRA